MKHAPPELHRSGMVRRWGPLYFLTGLWVFFARLRMTEPSAERVRAADGDGTVVYALRTKSLVDYLALNEVLRRRRLPLASLGTMIRTTPFMPLGDMLRRIKRYVQHVVAHGRLPDPVASGWLEDHVARGRTAAIFLRRGTDIRDLFVDRSEPDAIAALLDAQDRARVPIRVCPVAVIWARNPERARSATLQAIMGTEDDPGSLGKLIQLLTGHRSALVQIGDPIDLVDALERFADEPRPRIAKRLRLLVRRYCYREQQVVRGPRLKSPAWTRRLVLGGKRIARLVDEEAIATNKSRESVQQRVLREYDLIAARFSYPWVILARYITRFLWNRIYTGIDVREEDLERVRQAQREGVAVLVPCHRSHLDYMLLSSLLHEHDIVIPHVVAGENLSFFPLGAVLRRVGAVFIKRTWRGERVHPTIFSAYMTHLFREGYTVEFFIEGGRSRTGKMLPPKLGILGLTVDAGWEARVGRTLDEVSWLPVAVSYEQVAEEGPYARELSGGEKQPESLAQVVKAGGVLRKRYGRVYVRVGEPIKLSELRRELPTTWPELDRDQRQEALQRLGERLTHRIQERVVVLPTSVVSLALFAQRPGPVSAELLGARVERLRALLDAGGAEPSAALKRPGAVQEALARFLREGMVARLQLPGGVSFEPVDERRITLEYYKNGVLHVLVPASLLAAEIRARGDDDVVAADLLGSLRFQLFQLRYELVLDPEADEDAVLSRGLAQLVDYGALEAHGDHWRVIDRARVGELAELTVNILESYFAVLRGLHLVARRDLDRKELSEELRRVAQKLLSVEDIHRPEALSLASLKNAVRAFEEERLVQLRSGGGLELDEGGWRTYVEAYRRLLRVG